MDQVTPSTTFYFFSIVEQELFASIKENIVSLRFRLSLIWSLKIFVLGGSINQNKPLLGYLCWPIQGCFALLCFAANPCGSAVCEEAS